MYASKTIDGLLQHYAKSDIDVLRKEALNVLKWVIYISLANGQMIK